MSDYTSSVTGFDGEVARNDLRWWLVECNEPGDDVHLAETTFAAAHYVDEQTTDRQQEIWDSYHLYGDTSAWPSAGGSSRILPISQRMRRNVIAGAADTHVSEVTQNMPRPMFVTIGGSYMDGVNARRVTNFIDGKFQSEEMRELAPAVYRDGVIAGLGAAYSYVDWDRKKSCIERVFPLHVLIDDVSCVDTKPRAFYMRKYFDKEELVILYPEHAEAIRGAATLDPDWSFSGDPRSDSVEVLYAWHLPTKPVDMSEQPEHPDEDDEKAVKEYENWRPDTDGRFFCGIREATFVDDPWMLDDPPLQFCRPIAPLRGFWPDSYMTRAAPEQKELNKQALRIQDSMHANGIPKIWMQTGSFPKSHMHNDVGLILEGNGPPPQILAWPSMHPEVYQREITMEEGIIRRFGVSSMAVNSEKPAGLNSGRALRMFAAAQTKRHINPVRAYEGFVTGCATQTTRREREISEVYPEHEVVVDRRGAKVRIPWTDLDYEEKNMLVHLHPAGALPTDPSAKVEVLQEMMADGSIDKLEFHMMADSPDTESIRDDIVAPVELLRQRFDMMLEDNRYMPPERYMNLEDAIRRCGNAIQRAEVQDVPEERIEHLRKFLADAMGMLKESQAAAAGPSPALGPPGMTPPETVPGADALLPGPPPVDVPPGPPPGAPIM